MCAYVSPSLEAEDALPRWYQKPKTWAKESRSPDFEAVWHWVALAGGAPRGVPHRVLLLIPALTLL